jgi:hypothetical protein
MVSTFFGKTVGAVVGICVGRKVGLNVGPQISQMRKFAIPLKEVVTSISGPDVGQATS